MKTTPKISKKDRDLKRHDFAMIVSGLRVKNILVMTKLVHKIPDVPIRADLLRHLKEMSKQLALLSKFKEEISN